MKSVFFCGLSVLVVAIAVVSCAGQSNRTNPSGAGAAQMTQSRSSGNATPSNCSWTLPGDGMGASRLICSSVPNATIPGRTPSNGTGTIRTAADANGGGGNTDPFDAGGYAAFQQGANSVADLNVMSRDSMVSSALQNWQAPTEQQDATTALSQNASLADPFANTGNPTGDGSEDAATLPPPVPGPPPSPDPSLGQASPMLILNPQLWKGAGEITAGCLTIAAVCAAGVPTGGAGAVAAAFTAQGATATIVAGTVNVWSAISGDSTVGERTDQFLGAVKNPAGQFATAFTGDLNAGNNAANIADGIMTFGALPEMDLPSHPVLSLFNANQAATSLQEGTMSMQSALSSIRPPSFAYPSPMPTPPLPSQATNAEINSPTPQPAPTPSPEATPSSN
jgi:hypothetical protein